MIFWILAVCLLGLASCGLNQNVTELNIVNKLDVKEGRIVFNNTDDISKYMTFVKSQDLDKEFGPSIRSLEKKGFNSLIPHYDKNEISKIEDYVQKK
ncbi:MAG: hypothetical protein MUE85_03345 [Microscillaceae bacterium]|jgi:hypothetical protein|nr:hypothetical protein [Microscillaceae bacterium]